MAKNKVSEWSAVPANNTDIGGIDIAEGCAPSGINNGIRELMAQVKDMITGADGDSQTIGGNLVVNGTSTLTGAVTATGGVTGAITSSNATITGGTITGITDLTVADGGTGASSITANSVILGNGTSALSGNLVAPSTSGNVLTSNGTTWTSAAPVVPIPSGAVMHFAMNTAPTGWLAANGTAVSRTTYAALFAAIGTVFGSGDGSTTFNLPDLRAEFIRGIDNGRGVDSGRGFGSNQSATEIASNIDQAAFFSYTNNDAFRSGSNLNGAGEAGYIRPQNFISVRPRNVALLACIKV
jgi:microcystin-dependent protein